MMKSTNNKALEMALDAQNWTDDAIQKFVSQKSLPEPLACKPGCYYCCYNLPMVTPPESLLIGRYVQQTFSEPKQKEIMDNITNIIERIEGVSPNEIVMMRHELPCFFLKDAMCMIYDVRPIICRTCTSTSAEHCKMIFETKDHRARMRCYQHIREIFHTVHSRLIEDCRKMGCQPDALPLIEAIRDYFSHSDPIEAWLQGEFVFSTPV